MQTRLPFLFAVGIALSLPSLAAAQNVASQQSTTTATVDRIDRFSRTLTLRRDNSITQMMSVDPSETLFDDLRTGDRITVFDTDSTIVQVRPDAALSSLHDTTLEARAANDRVLQQLTSVVAIDRIDPDQQYVLYHTGDGVKTMRAVADPTLLRGIRSGDRIEVTWTHERAVSIERSRR